MIVGYLRGTFKYRKTSLTLLVLVTVVLTVLFSSYDSSLEYSVDPPSDGQEQSCLQAAWSSLQEIARYEHTYGSTGNDYVHDYLKHTIARYAKEKSYIEYDTDSDNNLLFHSQFLNPKHLIYYESNNLVVRVNGTNPSLPALLLSAHYDSVPTSTGVTDDGMGIASMLGVLHSLSISKQPERTIVFNFNNDEEFGLNGANAFLSHPWSHNVSYFLNLEGTGAGGKAILFRGTDYGITKFFGGVRYPFASSIYQMGFHNGLVHSETDYVVYRDRGGLRGLDVAFYKPRDIYHTRGDNINNINIKSLWHMLSISLDFVKTLDTEIDLDTEETGSDFAVFTTFFNYFFAFPVSKLIQVNIALLILIPLLSFPLLVIVLQFKKNWKWTLVNVIKFPISLTLAILVLQFATDYIVGVNEFVINSSPAAVIFTLSVTFALSNWAILNGVNLVFSYDKVINHDEKLITLIEISFLNWVVLIWSTYKLANNKLGDDHTGEFVLPLLFILQAVSVLLGLVGWTLTKSQSVSHESQSLLENDHVTYGTEESEASSSASSLLSVEPIKYLSYDWLPQFLMTVPLSSLIIYKSGDLIIQGLHKTVQESLNGEVLLYKFVQIFVVVWVIPYLPFVFKFNKIIFTLLAIASMAGFIVLNNTAAFDQLNPLKLRFYQSIDLDSPKIKSYVHVRGRETSPALSVLQDLPSVKKKKTELQIVSLGDGLQEITYASDLTPVLAPNMKSFSDYIEIEVLKNSSFSNGSPFGWLTGEIKIKAPKNRLCNLRFNTSEATTEIKQFQGLSTLSKDESPVKAIIIYATPKNITESVQVNAFPEGFSRDKNGNYLYKNLGGIEDLQLKKLDWDTDYHIGFQWVPSFVEADYEASKVTIHKLGVQLQCLWADLSPTVDKNNAYSPVPAYDELLHYSPNYISYANTLSGLVEIRKYIDL